MRLNKRAFGDIFAHTMLVPSLGLRSIDVGGGVVRRDSADCGDCIVIEMTN